jgi:hypothetical protein
MSKRPDADLWNTAAQAVKEAAKAAGDDLPEAIMVRSGNLTGTFVVEWLPTNRLPSERPKGARFRLLYAAVET